MPVVLWREGSVTTEEGTGQEEGGRDGVREEDGSGGRGLLREVVGKREVEGEERRDGMKENKEVVEEKGDEWEEEREGR